MIMLSQKAINTFLYSTYSFKILKGGPILCVYKTQSNKIKSPFLHNTRIDMLRVGVSFQAHASHASLA